MICAPRLLIVQKGLHKSWKTAISPYIWEYFKKNHIINYIYLCVSNSKQTNHNTLSEQLVLLLCRGLLPFWFCFMFACCWVSVGGSPESSTPNPVHACPSLKSWKPEKLFPLFSFVTYYRAFLLQSTWLVSGFVGTQLWRLDVWLTMSSFITPVIFYPPTGTALTLQFLAINLSQKLTM